LGPRKTVNASPTVDSTHRRLHDLVSSPDAERLRSHSHNARAGVQTGGPVAKGIPVGLGRIIAYPCHDIRVIQLTESK
jgi:hypothetical protein